MLGVADDLGGGHLATVPYLIYNAFRRKPCIILFLQVFGSTNVHSLWRVPSCDFLHLITKYFHKRMPRAAKSTTRGSAAASRTDPLRSKSGRSKPKRQIEAASTEQAASSLDQHEKRSIEPEIGTDQDEKQSMKPKMDTDSNYLVIVHMTLSYDPIITRLFSLPPHLALDKLHQVLQIAFGWANCHMHSFQVTLSDEKRPFPRSVAYLLPMSDDEPDMGYIRLEESDYTLHDVFSREIFSRDVFLNTEWEGSKVTPKMKLGLVYEYDHGDGWTHQITLMGRADPGLHRAMRGSDAPGVLCLGGEGHPCAEDCGSAPGWQNLKEIFTKPRKKDADDLKDWYKTTCANGDPDGLNPWKWDIFQVNKELRMLTVWASLLWIRFWSELPPRKMSERCECS